MRSMRKTGIVRLMVAVLDVNCIPDDADIVVDDCLYEIYFKVDQLVNDNGEDPGYLDKDDDIDPENQNKEKDHEMEDIEKQNNNGSASSGSSSYANIPKATVCSTTKFWCTNCGGAAIS